MAKSHFNQNEQKLLDALTDQELESLIYFALGSAEARITDSSHMLDNVDLDKVDIKAVALEILTRKEKSPLEVKLNEAIQSNDYSHLTTAEENELITRHPSQFMRDEPIELNGKVVYDGLLNANANCNHLVKTLSSGVTCVKCHGWYCA